MPQPTMDPRTEFSQRTARLLDRARRILRKPPRVIAERAIAELRAEGERLLVHARRRTSLRSVLHRLGETDLDTLWHALAERPYLAHTCHVGADEYDACFPHDRKRILERADDALNHRVDLLGSGLVNLGDEIDWHTDFKSGHRWPPRFFRDIRYDNPELPSDVKVPWELSRMQWLIPVGQAYLLTADEAYAHAVKRIILDWIGANPLGGSVNWACTMDVALRAITWTWLFHVFHRANAWSDPHFRAAFVTSLYAHGSFIERHIEKSDVNGNHYAADAAGMMIVGTFFGRGTDAARWASQGWHILEQEIGIQVLADGVDFEASVPYHRLVAELFLLPALYRVRMGEEISPPYRTQLTKMASFTAAYTKPNGCAPVWGDADDARVLPFGPQHINDHRYLVTAVAEVTKTEIAGDAQFDTAELFWLLGHRLENRRATRPAASAAFPAAGFFVMRGNDDHVFIDCGPVGLAGRGGHGHNDCLSFEATLSGRPLIIDCGAYLYTASYAERNRFRSTSSHNTPMIDGEEINRIDPALLWLMQNDAKPSVLEWHIGEEFDRFCGTHGGYNRLQPGLRPIRTIELNKVQHRLLVEDAIDGTGRHDVQIPYHLDPCVRTAVSKAGLVKLEADGKRFDVEWSGADFHVTIEDARTSPSYGVVQSTQKLVFRRTGVLPCRLTVSITPRDRVDHDNATAA